MTEHRAKAALILAKHLFGSLSESRGRLPAFLEVEGGDYLFASAVHIYRVDLVLEKVTVE